MTKMFSEKSENIETFININGLNIQIDIENLCPAPPQKKKPNRFEGGRQMYIGLVHSNKVFKSG